MNLSSYTKMSVAITPTDGASGTSLINGTTLDMTGWDGVLMLVTFGAINTGAVTSIKAQQGATANMSDAADLAGTRQTIADTDDDKTFYIDLYRPRERYVRLVVSRGTAAATVASALYIQYKGSKLPALHGANVAGELHVSPDEGTA